MPSDLPKPTRIPAYGLLLQDLQSYRHEQLLCAALRGWVNVAPFRHMLPCHLYALDFLEEDTWPNGEKGGMIPCLENFEVFLRWAGIT